MTNVSKKLADLISSTHKKLIDQNRIMPVKTPDGILVGSVLIVSENNVKHLVKNSQVVYHNIALNSVAIKLANMLANNYATHQMDALYRADQEYGRWYIDSQFLSASHYRAVAAQDYDRSDMLWARYIESKDRALTAKKKAEALAAF